MSGLDAPLINLSGDLVSLGPLNRDLIPDYLRWSNDISTSQTLGLSWPTTEETEIDTFNQRVADPDAVYFTVYQSDGLLPVGIAYLYEIHTRHSRASFGIIIGESRNRGRGFGTAATHMVLDYAFNQLGLSNVMLTVLSFNLGGIRAYEKAGFQTFGTRKSCSRSGRSLYDLVYMQCTPDDFQNLEDANQPAPSAHASSEGD